MIHICEHCKTEIDDLGNYRIFNAHKSSCKCNPKSIQKKLKNSIATTNILIKKLGEYKFFKVICIKCGKEFEVREREKQFPKKEKYYCSQSCANSRTWSEADNINKSLKMGGIGLTKSMRDNKIIPKSAQINKICRHCGIEFKDYIKSNKHYCSHKCSSYRKFNHTNETKIKLSTLKKQLYKEHPEKHPNVRCSNNISYPEKMVMQYFINNGLIKGIDFIHQYKIGNYYIDFYIPKLNLGIEIDGERWHTNTDKEQIREKFIKQYITLYRFWSKPIVKKEHQNDFDTIINKIRE